MSIQKQIRQQQAKKERRAIAVNSMGKVLSHPTGTPERWRAAYNHFLLQRPEAKPEADYIAAGVRERRKDMDKYASTKNGRMAYSTPEWLLLVLKNTDPEYFGSRTPKDFMGVKHLTLMKKAFPEYFYAEVI